MIKVNDYKELKTLVDDPNVYLGDLDVSAITDMSFLFEQAGVQISATEQGKWLTAFPKEQQELYLKEYPEAKKNWDDVYGDREIKLVFIGQHMDKEKIIADLDKCVTQ